MSFGFRAFPSNSGEEMTFMPNAASKLWYRQMMITTIGPNLKNGDTEPCNTLSTPSTLRHRRQVASGTFSAIFFTLNFIQIL